MKRMDRAAYALIVIAVVLMVVLVVVGGGCRKVQKWERRIERAEDAVDTAGRIKGKAAEALDR